MKYVFTFYQLFWKHYFEWVLSTVTGCKCLYLLILPVKLKQAKDPWDLQTYTNFINVANKPDGTQTKKKKRELFQYLYNIYLDY